MYAIGHPKGGRLTFSLHDSVWLDADTEKVHYRTPTDPGSSGSPVFDQKHWSLLALHHAGSQRMARLKGKPGNYEANEGLAVAAIRRIVAENPKT